MRRMLGALLTVSVLLLLPSVAHAGAPQIPNVATSTNWLPFQTPSYPGPWDNPFGISLVTQPNPYSWIYQPGISSPPIFNLPICPGDITTTFVLNYCGGLIGAPAPGNGQLYPSFPNTLTGPGGFGGSIVTGTGSLGFTPPVGCMSNTGGPCVTLCLDGTWSSSTGPGTCAFHGGVA